MPLELFVFLGTFIEEVISPIPSFVVLVPAGAVAQAQGGGTGSLLLLVVFSAVGRIAGGLILYWLADKFEDKLLGNGRRFFGISHKQIERFGKRLSKNRRHEWSILFLMNALPVFPAAVLSLSCGFIKVRLKVFIICTFFGTMINALIYLLIGYSGFAAAEALRHIELASQITLAVLLVGVGAWLIRHKRLNTGL